MVTTTNNTNAFGFATNSSGANDKVATGVAVSENKDMFTKLLVAQIRNQDPLSPSDPSQFVNQLSQLSQTEALQKLAQTTSASASMLQSLQSLAMGAQVGNDVSVLTDRVRIGDAALSGAVQLDGASSLTHVVLTGIDGQQHRIALPPHGSGAQAFNIDPAALGLAPGNYGISAEASDGTKPSVEITGRLDSVRMAASGGIALQVGGIGDVDPAMITGFKGKPALAAAGSDN